jgi:uncharacterized protein YjbI with pentapeptide repeats
MFGGKVMDKEVGILVKKPKSILQKSVKVEFKDLFTCLSKAVVQGSFNNWADAISEAIGGISCFGLENKPEDKAWRLIYSSAVNSVFDIVNENKELFRGQDINSDLLNRCIETVIDECEFTIEGNFFRDPSSIPVFNDLRKIFKMWLNEFKLTDFEIDSIINRLDSYFVFALNNEWIKNLEDYKELYEILSNPFNEKVKKETEWLRYSAWLKKQIDEPLFLEAFSLKQVYVKLNAYYQKIEDEENEEDELNGINRKSSKEDKKVVVDLEDELDKWTKSEDMNDYIKIICGGPGSGKSSFAKIFAAQQAENNVAKVLYIPLHHFLIDNDLIKAIGKFVKYDGFITYNPLEDLDNNSRLLLIFDGLDELEVQGKVGTEVAQSFIRDVKDELNNINKRNLKVKAIITSRNVAIQLNQNELKKEKQIYNILEYYIEDIQYKRHTNVGFKTRKYKNQLTKQDFIDPQHLLDEDKRNTWWVKYGKVKGGCYNEIPKEINNYRLIEITSQPLLNYLVALSFERNTLNFEVEDNLNKIYEDLLVSVYNREWDEGVHNSVKDIDYKKFLRVLEEISIATWHGNGRTTTVKEIEKYFESSNLKRIVDVFKTENSGGITRLLLAFYFRKSGNSFNGENTFEFTHKSFGEYLAAKRIIRGIQIISNQIEEREKDIDEGLKGWNYKDALISWFQICGPAKIDEYIFDFIKNEIQLYDTYTVEKWQKVFINLLNYNFKLGIPFNILAERPSYFEEYRQSRNVEESLFIILNCFTTITKQSYNLEYPTKMYLGEWLKKLQGQRINSENPLFFDSINYMNIEGCYLHGQDLYSINIHNSSAIGTQSSFSNFVRSSLSKINFSNSMFNGTLFKNSVIKDVNFKKGIFIDANFKKALLKNVDFDKGNLLGANFQFANLYNVKFNYANLKDVDFNNSILNNVDFTGAKIDKIRPFKAKVGDKLIYINDGLELRSVLKDGIIDCDKIINKQELDETVADKEERLG